MVSSRSSDSRLVHSGRGLVQQQEARPARECARDLDPPLLAVGERRGHALAVGLQADLLQQRAHRRERPPAGNRAHLDVLAHGHVAEQADLLERPPHAQPREHVRPLPGGRVARHLDPPGSRAQHAAGDVQERGLAAAVGPDQAHDLPLPHRHVDVVERPDTAELLDDALGDDRRPSFGDRCAHGARSYR